MTLRHGLSMLLLGLCLVTPVLAGFGVDWRSSADNLRIVGAARIEDEYILRRLDQVGGVYYPGQKVVATIAQPAQPKSPVGNGVIEAVAFHTGQYDPSETGFVHGKQARTIERLNVPVAVTPWAKLQDEAGKGRTGTIAVPDALGMYALVLRRGNGEGSVIGVVARVLPPAPLKNGQLPQIMGEYGLPGGKPWASPFTHEERTAALARVGIGLIRREISTGVAKVGDTETVFGADTDSFFAAARAHGLKVMVTLGAHTPTEQPWLVSGKTLTHILPPARDPEIKQWLSNYARRYWSGGDAGLWGLEHWNEPWEPEGISGWNGDNVRYRQLLQVIHDAARSVDPRLKVIATCSVMNTEDKLIADGSDRWIKLVDVMSDHYVSLWASYGPRVAEKYGLLSGETETWGAHSQVLLAQFMCQFLSGGQRFVNPATVDMLWSISGEDMRFPAPKNPKEPAIGVVTPMPVAVTVAAWNAIIQNRPFERLCFTTHLPLLYQFGADDDARFVLAGKLTSTGSGRMRDYPWSQAWLGPNGTLTVSDPGRVLEIRDLSGNIVAPDARGDYRLLMDTRSYFVSSRAPAQTVVDLIRAGKLEGMRQVEIMPRTLTRRSVSGQTETLPVKIHNLRNRTVAGTLKVESLSPSGVLGAPRQLEIAAGAEVTVDVPVMESPASGLPLRFVFQAPGTPPETWEEVIPVTGIVRATLSISGDISAWDKIPAVTVLRPEGESGVTEMEAVWLPFVNKTAEKIPAKRGELRLAWDDKHLYVFGAVDDAALNSRPRVAVRDDDKYFWSERAAAAYEPLKPWAKFLAVPPGNKVAQEKLKQDKDWPAYQKFLAEHPELKPIAESWKTQVYFSVKKQRPNASLDEINYAYRGQGMVEDLPFSGDNLQLGFDFDAPETYTTATHDLKLPFDRLPHGWIAVPDTDYELSLYACDDGKPELWCLLAPGVPRGHYMPRAPKAATAQHAIEAASVVVNQEGRTFYRAAIPWAALGVAAPRPGMNFGFTFRFNVTNNGKKDTTGWRGDIAFGDQAGATKMNGLTLHPYWNASPSNTIRWTLLP